MYNFALVHQSVRNLEGSERHSIDKMMIDIKNKRKKVFINYLLSSLKGNKFSISFMRRKMYALIFLHFVLILHSDISYLQIHQFK